MERFEKERERITEFIECLMKTRMFRVLSIYSVSCHSPSLSPCLSVSRYILSYFMMKTSAELRERERANDDDGKLHEHIRQTFKD